MAPKLRSAGHKRRGTGESPSANKRNGTPRRSPEASASNYAAGDESDASPEPASNVNRTRTSRSAGLASIVYDLTGSDDDEPVAIPGNPTRNALQAPAGDPVVEPAATPYEHPRGARVVDRLPLPSGPMRQGTIPPLLPIPPMRWAWPQRQREEVGPTPELGAATNRHRGLPPPPRDTTPPPPYEAFALDLVSQDNVGADAPPPDAGTAIVGVDHSPAPAALTAAPPNDREQATQDAHVVWDAPGDCRALLKCHQCEPVDLNIRGLVKHQGLEVQVKYWHDGGYDVHMFCDKRGPAAAEWEFRTMLNIQSLIMPSMRLTTDKLQPGRVYTVEIGGIVCFILIVGLLSKKNTSTTSPEFVAIGVHMYTHDQIDPHLGIPDFRGAAASTHAVPFHSGDVSKLIAATSHKYLDCMLTDSYTSRVRVLDTRRMKDGVLALKDWGDKTMVFERNTTAPRRG